jgi:hypothetical protein
MDAAYAWIVCAWIALHVAALIAAYFTRVAAGSRHENLSQLVCFGAMAIIGVAVWISQETHAGAWGLSAATLMGMVLTAVVDFRKLHDSHHPATNQH